MNITIFFIHLFFIRMADVFSRETDWSEKREFYHGNTFMIPDNNNISSIPANVFASTPSLQVVYLFN